MNAATICWLRQDLRLADNPALQAAIDTGTAVIPLYVDDTTVPPRYATGSAARWWQHHSLQALDEALRARGSGLVLRRGDPREVLSKLAQEAGVSEVHFNRRYEPHAVDCDKQVERVLGEQGVTVASHQGSLMFEPWQIKTGQGTPYKVFSQFWKRGCLGGPIEILQPRDAPSRLPALPEVASDVLDSWNLLPKAPDWSQGFTPLWQPGEAGAFARLEQFLDEGLRGYKTLRNRPDLEHVSRLSPHLHWGEIAPWRAWHAAAAAGASRSDIPAADVAHFQSELGWREFSYQLLFHFPTLPEKNWKPMFNAFPWSRSKKKLVAWQRGQTGYPLVDAGMRELWATGWMHNRVRMVVASFLIKHLMIHWREGERWFWDTLVDADLANNSASWQWVAGSGADAAPYFRIFNPITQGEKFDPDGEYIRRWVPEIAGLDNRSLFRPWEADRSVLRAAGIEIGRDYPAPIVDHFEARDRALAAYKAAKDDVG